MAENTILRNSGLYILRANGLILRSKEGLYTEAEISDLIINQGWIPIASASEFHSMQLTGNRIMGDGTMWRGIYTTGLTSDKKYIQVRNIDMFDYYNETDYVRINLLGIYDGNNLLIDNFRSDSSTGGNALFNSSSATVRILKNIRVNGQFGTSSTRRTLGGIISNGNPLGCEINNCYVEASLYISSTGGGGICGTNEGKINNCISKVQVDAVCPGVGGIVGSNLSGGEIINCFAIGNVIVPGITAHIGIGGIAGYNFGTISGCVFSGIVDGGRQTGGIVGQNNAGIVSKCYASGRFQARWDRSFPQCGGVVGVNTTSGGLVERCYSSGVVLYESTSSGSRQGGIVGENEAGCTVADSFSSCSVSSSRDMVGGAVGANSGTVVNCYATGVATGTTSVGGLIGNNTGTVTNSYYDKDTGGPTAGAGSARTTPQMKEGSASSFILPAGGTDPDSLAANAMYTSWDTAIWDFLTTADYPVLK